LASELDRNLPTEQIAFPHVVDMAHQLQGC